MDTNNQNDAHWALNAGQFSIRENLIGVPNTVFGKCCYQNITELKQKMDFFFYPLANIHLKEEMSPRQLRVWGFKPDSIIIHLKTF